MAERVNLSGFNEGTGLLNPFPVEHSHQLLLSTGNHTCGATLITAFMALTAAHCVSRHRASEVMIFTENNRSSSNNHRVKKLIIHEEFNENTHAHDLAILVFETAISTTDFPTTPNELTFFQGQPVIITWSESKTSKGSTTEYFQNSSIAFIATSERCRGEIVENYTQNQLCVEAAEDQTCFKDSSSQLLCFGEIQLNHTVYICGIFSWAKGCSKEHLAVFTEIAPYQSWISGNIQKNSPTDDEKGVPFPSCTSYSEFRCNISNECKPVSYLCDGDEDCPDGGDEANCLSNNTCNPIQFPCRTGNKCILRYEVCDGSADCPDGSDEFDCPINGNSCGKNKFPCLATSKSCYAFSDVCDGHDDCKMENVSTDEANCAPGVNGCAWNRFACQNNSGCIPAYKKCNGKKDCEDGSDETNCHLPGACHWTAFSCRQGGICRQNSHKCDKDQDCPDGSDEENCAEYKLPCLLIEFRCHENGACIPGYLKCDGKKDCRDGSDEDNCQAKPKFCSRRELPCKKAHNCFALLNICDGKKDCGKFDSTDEDNCIRGPNGCHWNQFPCKTERACIPAVHKCNGKKDCADGSDEEHCEDGSGCHWTQFVCQNDSKCIHRDRRCDGEKDCQDNSDETNCNGVCHWAEFQCSGDRHCIAGRFKCDGNRDCKDGSDEADCDSLNTGTISGTQLTIYIAIPTCIIILLLIVLIFVLRKYWNTSNRLSEMEIKLFERGDEKLCQTDKFAHENAQFLPYNRDYEVKWKDFELNEDSKLGEGAYGVVFRGAWAGNSQGAVAIKTVKPNVEKSILLALLSELKVMIHLGKHENIVELFGACTEYLRDDRDCNFYRSSLGKSCCLRYLQNIDTIITQSSEFCRDFSYKPMLGVFLEVTRLKLVLFTNIGELCKFNSSVGKFMMGRVYMLVEFCPMGSLHGYLKEMEKRPFGEPTVDLSPVYVNSDAVELKSVGNDSLSVISMLQWAVQIARGMQHLQSKKVIHGDLATRNVLLHSKHHVKITDFGLSRQLLNYDNYVKKTQAMLPWRWLALETLKSFEFSHKSDVWAYGITLWEIFSMAGIPYPGMGWTAEFLDFLESNSRLFQPKYANEEIYNIMCTCWHSEPESRPDFIELEQKLRVIMGREAPRGSTYLRPP